MGKERLIEYLELEQKRRLKDNINTTIWSPTPKLIDIEKNNLFDFANWSKLASLPTIMLAATCASNDKESKIQKEALEWLSQQV